MKSNTFIVILGAGFLAASGLFYFIHYLVFHDPHHIFIYMVGDLAFLPLEVLLVGLVIERIIARRETQAKVQKLNMVVGAFFSETGNHLLRSQLDGFVNREEISQHLNVSGAWSTRDFRTAAEFAHHMPIQIDHSKLDLIELKSYLSQRRWFFLSLLQNPSLLENDRFTDLLWAVTHLDEELEARTDLANLPDKDLAHIAGDVRRMYDNLASEWLDYAAHLKSNYPYLFSLILRTHPFQDSQSPIVT